MQTAQGFGTILFKIFSTHLSTSEVQTYLSFWSIVADAATAASHIFHCHIQGVHSPWHCVVKHQHRRDDAHSMNIALHLYYPSGNELLVVNSMKPSFELQNKCPRQQGRHIV